jgi:hypothetical protein
VRPPTEPELSSSAKKACSTNGLEPGLLADGVGEGSATSVSQAAASTVEIPSASSSFSTAGV